jgi:hypothetical protein
VSCADVPHIPYIFIKKWIKGLKIGPMISAPSPLNLNPLNIRISLTTHLILARTKQMRKANSPRRLWPKSRILHRFCTELDQFFSLISTSLSSQLALYRSMAKSIQQFICGPYIKLITFNDPYTHMRRTKLHFTSPVLNEYTKQLNATKN